MRRIPSVRASLDRRRRHRRNERPPEPPPGWSVAPPDFVGVGVQKAGTSWWYEQIVDHPDVVRPPQAHKELRYFNRFGAATFTDEDVERYHRLFPRPPGARSGEWTPSYVADHWVPPLLARAAPDARVLVILRDPVDRYLSGLVEAGARGRSVGLAEQRTAFWRGCYASQVERLLAWFPRRQVLVLQYERLVADPAGGLRDTYEHLGVEPGHRPAGLRERVHATRGERPAVDDGVAEVLAVAYRDETRRLVDLCPEIDLDLWPSFT